MHAETLGLIGTLTGGFSVISGIIGLGYVLGFWKGRVDTTLKEFRDKFDACNCQQTAEQTVMVNTLWQVYVIDALRRLPDLAEQHSPWHLKAPAQSMIGISQSACFFTTGLHQRIGLPYHAGPDYSTQSRGRRPRRRN